MTTTINLANGLSFQVTDVKNSRLADIVKLKNRLGGKMFLGFYGQDKWHDKQGYAKVLFVNENTVFVWDGRPSALKKYEGNVFERLNG